LNEIQDVANPPNGLKINEDGLVGINGVDGLHGHDGGNFFLKFNNYDDSNSLVVISNGSNG
jgi:hypothetical protein